MESAAEYRWQKMHVRSPSWILWTPSIRSVRIRSCPLDLVTHGTKLCPLHRRLDAALAQVEQAFRSTTLAEVLSDPGKIKPLCETEPRPKKRRHKTARL